VLRHTFDVQAGMARGRRNTDTACGVREIVKPLAIAVYTSFPRIDPKPLFPRYEAVRQSLLTGSLGAVKSNAAALATDARASKQVEIAADAEALAKSGDIAGA
jgi:hypothetical protein